MLCLLTGRLRPIQSGRPSGSSLEREGESWTGSKIVSEIKWAAGDLDGFGVDEWMGGCVRPPASQTTAIQWTALEVHAGWAVTAASSHPWSCPEPNAAQLTIKFGGPRKVNFSPLQRLPGLGISNGGNEKQATFPMGDGYFHVNDLNWAASAQSNAHHHGSSLDPSWAIHPQGYRDHDSRLSCIPQGLSRVRQADCRPGSTYLYYIVPSASSVLPCACGFVRLVIV